jgi:nucleoside-diphosphate-sugar epimerase
MTMGEAVGATLELADAEQGALSRCVYNIASFSASAGELAAEVRKHFPGAEIAYEVDTQRQAIVDSWPADMDCSAAARDWGFTPRHTMAGAFSEVLVPGVKTRYGV